MLASIRPVGVECGTHPLSRLVGLLSSRRHVGVSAWRGGVGLPTVAIAVGVVLGAVTGAVVDAVGGQPQRPMAPVGAATVLATTLGPPAD